MGFPYVFFWIGLIVVVVILEAISSDFIFIWFAAGSIAGIIMSALGFTFGLQIVGFLSVSVLTFIFLRPLAKRNFNVKHIPTNSDMLIGMTGIVTEDINNLTGSGKVVVEGLTWSALSSQNDSTIDKNKTVKIVNIVGVKLVVDLN